MKKLAEEGGPVWPSAAQWDSLFRPNRAGLALPAAAQCTLPAGRPCYVPRSRRGRKSARLLERARPVGANYVAASRRGPRARRAACLFTRAPTRDTRARAAGRASPNGPNPVLERNKPRQPRGCVVKGLVNNGTNPSRLTGGDPRGAAYKCYFHAACARGGLLLYTPPPFPQVCGYPGTLKLYILSKCYQPFLRRKSFWFDQWRF